MTEKQLEKNFSMSHRRWRQNSSPGREPGVQVANKIFKPAKRAAEISIAPPGLRKIVGCVNPGLAPGATNMPPAMRAR
jgi:hypothetical protein